MFGQRETRNSIFIYFVRGFVIFTVFFVISKITSFATMLYTVSAEHRQNSVFSGLPDFAGYLTSSVAALFIFNSVSLAFATFDKDELRSFLERDNMKISFFTEISDILKTPHLVIEIASTLIFTAVAALLGGFSEIGAIFFESSHRSGYFPAVILVTLCLIPSVLSKYEARRHWYKLKRENSLDKVTSSLGFALRLAVILLLYPLFFPLSPILVFIVFNLFSVLISLVGSLKVIGTAAVMILSAFILVALPILRALARRKRFLKRLHETADAEGYSVCDIKNPYSSIFKRGKQFTFDLFLGKEIYDCLVITTLRRGVPLIFNSPTSAYFEYRLGTAEHHISINRHVDFFLHGEGAKIIVVMPSPKHVYVTDGVKRKRLSQADKIWSCTVHDDVSFLGAMGRRSLHKNNSGEY